ncbi:hypothetical protein V757_09180 [Pelistega indica]|uniref:YhdP central domain-containing protein n=1 Tax=Pelistega indica TaxID=1414851 RepID=V8G0I5_9BURK|nr:MULTISPECIES: AsmA-like C-terminal region-containing protein [Pelistega]ETD69212.1 hypothetical protein V757_09180 [Pelistega indica]
MTLLILVGRFYLAPNIDNWRPEIIQWLQKNVHPSLQFEKIVVDWEKGLIPHLQVKQASLSNEKNNDDAKIGLLELAISPRSLLMFKPEVSSIRVSDAELVVERNSEGRILLGGKLLASQDGSLKVKPMSEQDMLATLKPWLSWGFERLPQKILIDSSRIVWRDKLVSGVEDLVFEPVYFNAEHDQQKLTVDLHISPPKKAGSFILLNANVDKQGNGFVNINWKDWYPHYFKNWVAFPLIFQTGKIKNAEAHFTFNELNITDFTTHSQLEDFVFQDKESVGGKFLLSGKNISVDFSSKNGLSKPYQFALASDDLHIEANEFFRHPMQVNKVRIEGVYNLLEGDIPEVVFNHAHLEIPKGKMSVTGSWRFDPHSDNGIVDINANVSRLELSQLANYLPKTIDADALDWLEKAFLQGYAENAEISVKGVVDHIPFGEHASSGDFRIKGDVRDVQLHYHQFPARENTYWPDIYVKEGTIDFNRGNILIKGPQLSFNPELALSKLATNDAQVEVNNIEKNTKVLIKTGIETNGDSFLKFYRHSPLRPLLNKVLDKTKISGELKGNLDLTIPIMDPDKTKVDAQFDAYDTSFQFSPNHPTLMHADGKIKINEKHVEIEKINGKLLGGSATLQGGIGAKGDILHVNGKFTGQGLRDFLPLKGLHRVQGVADYATQIHFLGGDLLDVNVQSQLQGLSIDLPNGMGKSASQKTPLSVKLIAPKTHQYEQLKIDFKDFVHIVFEHKNRSINAFNRGVIAINKPAKLPVDDLSIDALGGDWDINAWLDIVDEFSTYSSGSLPVKSTSSSSAKPSLFPSLRQISAKVNSLSLFDVIVKNIQAVGQLQANTWQFNLDSNDIQGDISLKSLHGRVERIDADLNRVSFSAKENFPSSTDTDDISSKTSRVDLMDINGKIKQLYWNKQLIGSIDINSKRISKDQWQLDSLRVSNDVASLFATGQLISDTTKTGMQMKVNINTVNMGDFLSYFNYKDFMKAGTGFANLEVAAPDVRHIRVKDLDVSGNAQIKHGALLTLDTTATKALALISLQSLSSLANLTTKTPSVMGKGLPFDFTRAFFELKNNRFYVSDFRLDSPILAMAAVGNTEIASKKLNFQVAAIPKIEMSGTAVLAGIIVNPVVGLGAFLSQWLLSDSLNRALTTYLHVSGDWDNPLINDQPLPKDEELKDEKQQKNIDALYRN